MDISPPTPDEEILVEVVVVVKALGKPDKVNEEVLLSVARAVGPRFNEVLFRLPTDEVWYKYDKFGDDMGHHPDHDSPLVEAARVCHNACPAGVCERPYVAD